MATPTNRVVPYEPMGTIIMQAAITAELCQDKFGEIFAEHSEFNRNPHSLYVVKQKGTAGWEQS